MRHFNLETFAGGELSRQINRDIEAVMRNVVDPNTDVKAKRKITVTIEFKPNEQRNFITTNVNSKPRAERSNQVKRAHQREAARSW